MKSLVAEREVFFGEYDPWDPSSKTPIASTLTEDESASNLLELPLVQPPKHWILHPKLLRIPMLVDIHGGDYNTSGKKSGIFVETVKSLDTISVIAKVLKSMSASIPPQFHNLIGKYVWHVHHYYEETLSEANHKLICVEMDCSEPGWELIAQTSDFMNIHPNDLEMSKDSAEEQKAVKESLQPIGDSYQHDGVNVIPKDAL
ncbi:hypothetical protein BT96DRAFT_942390 [Gymnopus androsaceus JB14]|uniref:Uncharacterized protein n=1 Tax=Gymnopus androsaceus JB14 TaxID=1447944 RepID=A0A6A4HBS8_9AGAR|nr:hypothetical protein BT96DRAFT_942390 [Gymnopus androsaceus JB14]